MRVHEARDHGSASEIDDLLRSGDIDLAPAPGERNAPVAHHERIDHGVPGIHEVDATVGQEHRVSRGESGERS